MTHEIVTVIANVKVKPGFEDRARLVLLSAVGPTRAEPGCLTYDLHQSTTDPTEFLFHENWASEEALTTHAASTAAHRLAIRQQLSEFVDGPTRFTLWRRVS